MCLLWSVGFSDVVCVLAWALRPLVGVYWHLSVCFNDIYYPLMSEVSMAAFCGRVSCGLWVPLMWCVSCPWVPLMLA